MQYRSKLVSRHLGPMTETTGSKFTTHSGRRASVELVAHSDISNDDVARSQIINTLVEILYGDVRWELQAIRDDAVSSSAPDTIEKLDALIKELS